MLSLIVTVAFFTLESGMHHLLSLQLPDLSKPRLLETILMGGILFTFGAAVFIQIMAAVVSASPFSRAWAIHLRNGLYVNSVFDRIVRSLYSHGNEQKPQVIENLDQIKREPSIELKQREVVKL